MVRAGPGSRGGRRHSWVGRGGRFLLCSVIDIRGKDFEEMEKNNQKKIIIKKLFRKIPTFIPEGMNMCHLLSCMSRNVVAVSILEIYIESKV